MDDKQSHLSVIVSVMTKQGYMLKLFNVATGTAADRCYIFVEYVRLIKTKNKYHQMSK